MDIRLPTSTGHQEFLLPHNVFGGRIFALKWTLLVSMSMVALVTWEESARNQPVCRSRLQWTQAVIQHFIGTAAGCCDSVLLLLVEVKKEEVSSHSRARTWCVGLMCKMCWPANYRHTDLEMWRSKGIWDLISRLFARGKTMTKIGVNEIPQRGYWSSV